MKAYEKPKGVSMPYETYEKNIGTTDEGEPIIRVYESRTCDTCGVKMTEGYCIEGGEEYYCNDHEPADFLESYELSEDSGEYNTYWTTYEEESYDSITTNTGEVKFL
jgi:hypothetical protein